MLYYKTGIFKRKIIYVGYLIKIYDHLSHVFLITGRKPSMALKTD